MSAEAESDKSPSATTLVWTYELLSELGFVPIRWDSMGKPSSIALVVGDSALIAVQDMDWYRPIVRVTAITDKPDGTVVRRRLTLPGMVLSRADAIAIIAGGIDRVVGEHFLSSSDLPWVDEGRARFQLLPAQRERAEYEARQLRYQASPHCWIDREWARMAIRRLARLLEYASEDDEIALYFDGEILTLRFGDQLLPLPASGAPAWERRYSIPARALQPLPKRFRRPHVSVWIFEGSLSIDTYQYPGVTEIATEDT